MWTGGDRRFQNESSEGERPQSGFDSQDGDETMHAASVSTMLTVQIAWSIGDNRHPAILMEVWAILEPQNIRALVRACLWPPYVERNRTGRRTKLSHNLPK